MTRDGMILVYHIIGVELDLRVWEDACSSFWQERMDGRFSGGCL